MIRIGTRPSRLAVIQATMVSERIRALGYETEIVKHSSTGDADRTTPIYSINRTGVFVNELNDMILEGKIDIAVHSAKDIPYDMPDGLSISAVLERGPYTDCLVSEKPLKELEPGSRIGTSSLRRAYELRTARDDIIVENLRGNIETRIGKVTDGSLEGAVMAEAGIERLGIDVRHHRLDPAEFVPSPNQGIIAIVGMNGKLEDTMKRINDEKTYRIAMIERTIMRSLKLGCSTPVGILCTSRGSGFSIISRFYSLKSFEFTDIHYNLDDESDLADLIAYIRSEIPEEYGYTL